MSDLISTHVRPSTRKQKTISRQSEADAVMQALAKTILSNKRLTWMIVSAYLNEHGMCMVYKADEYATLLRLFPQHKKKIARLMDEAEQARKG